MSLPKYLFCNNKAELPNDSLVLQATQAPFIMGKVWQFSNEIPPGFASSPIPQVKIPGYRIYIRFYDSLEPVADPTDTLLAMAEMADYFLLHKIQKDAGAFKRYKEGN